MNYHRDSNTINTNKNTNKNKNAMVRYPAQIAAIIMTVILASMFFSACEKKKPLEDQESKALAYLLDDKKSFNDLSDYSLEIYLLVNSKVIKENEELQNKLSKSNAYKQYLDNLDRILKDNGAQLENNTIKDYATASLALKALKKNPENYKGNNLFSKLDDAELAKNASVIDKAWALIATKYLGLKLQNEEAYYNDLIAFAQNSSDEEAKQIEEQAIIAQALSYYHALPDTSVALSMIMERLENAQKDNGSFSDAKITGVVLMSLSSLGIDVETYDPLTKNEKTVKDGLSKFICDKGFKYNGKDDEINKVATLYALLGIEAQNRIETGGLFPKHK